jgi:hypothetical protein
VLLAGRARRAPAARVRGIERDAFTRTRPVRHRADELVPEHERVIEHRVSDAALREPVQVGAAEADGGHAQEQLARRGLGRRLVVQAQVALVVETKRDHRGCP